jgi:hypothetical protein
MSHICILDSLAPFFFFFCKLLSYLVDILFHEALLCIETSFRKYHKGYIFSVEYVHYSVTDNSSIIGVRYNTSGQLSLCDVIPLRIMFFRLSDVVCNLRHEIVIG